MTTAFVLLAGAFVLVQQGSAPERRASGQNESDQEGNLYTAEVFNGRAQKFRPKPGADPAKLIGQPVRAAWK